MDVMGAKLKMNEVELSRENKLFDELFIFEIAKIK